MLSAVFAALLRGRFSDKSSSIAGLSQWTESHFLGTVCAACVAIPLLMLLGSAECLLKGLRSGPESALACFDLSLSQNPLRVPMADVAASQILSPPCYISVRTGMFLLSLS